VAAAQSDLNPRNRQELKREDVPGTNMEIFISGSKLCLASCWPVTFIMVKKRIMCVKEQRLEQQNKVPTGASSSRAISIS
jgi:hypothetical protein